MHMIPDLQEYWVILQKEESSPSQGGGWPNSTQAKDPSVSAIAVIAQFTFWLISGASTEREYLCYIQERSCAQPQPTQRLFTPDRLLPSFWGWLNWQGGCRDREREREKCDARRAQMFLVGLRRQRQMKSLFLFLNQGWCNRNGWTAQVVQRCVERKGGCGEKEGSRWYLFFLSSKRWQHHLHQGEWKTVSP